jgi:O-succinylbenzoic acid--CoA ligase
MDRAFPLDDSKAAALGIDLWHIDNVALENGYEPGRSVVIRETSPQIFLLKFFAALRVGCPIWLADPAWGDSRMEEVVAFVNDAAPQPGAILIPTGGTTGRLRYAVHTWETLVASAEGFGEFYGEQGGHRTLCVLPMHHVSGLMQAVRVATLGGRFVAGSPHDPREGLPAGFSPEGFFLSLVPTQLRRLFDAGADDWLRGFRTILLGGAALDAPLADRARQAGLPLSPSYGMTETAAVACALKPAEFLAGAKGVGRPLPHVGISLEADSRVRICAKSLCKSMIPAGPDLSRGLLTNDVGQIDASGVLCIKCRADRAIVSGGQKIDAGEVEEVLLETGLLSDAFVVGMPDPMWGEKAVALYVEKPGFPRAEGVLRDAVRRKLSPVHVPKKWVCVPSIPRSAAGKPELRAIRVLAAG